MRLTFSLSMPPYLARMRGSRTVARLVPVTVSRVPPLKDKRLGVMGRANGKGPPRDHMQEWALSATLAEVGPREGAGDRAAQPRTEVVEGQAGHGPHLLMLHSGSILRMVGSSV